VRHKGKLDHCRFLVVDAENHVKGVVTENEIAYKFALISFPHNMMLASFKTAGLTATPSTPLKKILRMMVQGRQSCVTILKGQKPVGTIDESILAKIAAKEGFKAPASAKMAKKLVAAKAGSSVREAVIKMVKAELKEIVVTDEGGNYYGIVTLKDLVKHIEKTQL
jgi:CBS domain-containing protein